MAHRSPPGGRKHPDFVGDRTSSTYLSQPTAEEWEESVQARGMAFYLARLVRVLLPLRRRTHRRGARDLAMSDHNTPEEAAELGGPLGTPRLRSQRACCGTVRLPAEARWIEAPTATTWAQYQERQTTEKEIRRLYANPQRTGIGYFTGKSSGNLEVLDFDD